MIGVDLSVYLPLVPNADFNSDRSGEAASKD
jgi:hypothetical protein